MVEIGIVIGVYAALRIGEIEYFGELEIHLGDYRDGACASARRIRTEFELDEPIGNPWTSCLRRRVVMC